MHPLRQEDVAVSVAYAILRGGGDGYERISIEREELVVGRLSLLQHGLTLVVGKAKIVLILVLIHLARSPQVSLGFEQQDADWKRAEEDFEIIVTRSLENEEQGVLVRQTVRVADASGKTLIELPCSCWREVPRHE